MDVLATGADRVRALETALGGQPPEDRAPAAELDRYNRQRSDQRRTRYAETKVLLERRNALIQDLRERHPDLSSLLESLAQASLTKSGDRPRRQSGDRRHRLPQLERVEPRLAVGSGFTLKAPPYDDQGQGVQGDASASPDALQGNYSLQTTANCAAAYAWAGSL